MSMSNLAVAKPFPTDQHSLRHMVKESADHYLGDLDESLEGLGFYRLVMSQIEPAVIEAALQKARGNQCKAAELLGISRSTLRKKIEQYDIIFEEHD